MWLAAEDVRLDSRAREYEAANIGPSCLTGMPNEGAKYLEERYKITYEMRKK